MSRDIFIMGIVPAFLCAMFAELKGRRAWLWFIIGCFGSWFAVALLLIFPKERAK